VALFAVVIQLRGSRLEAAIGAVLGAAAAEAVLVRLDAARGKNATLRMPLDGATVALLTWAGYLLGAQLDTPPDLWVGVTCGSASPVGRRHLWVGVTCGSVSWR
jgi:hypothetical protein